MANIDDRIKAQRRQDLLRRLWGGKVAIGLVLVFLSVVSWNAYRASDKVIERTTVVGTVQGIHQTQDYLGSATTMVSIELDGGLVVMVKAPEPLQVRAGARVNVVEAKTDRGAVQYYFGDYIESAQ